MLGHPSVAECAVIAVPADEEAGEDEVMVVIVAAEPMPPAAVWEWCTGRVPAFAIPRYVRFVDKLPRTPSEKIQRAVLRDEAATATDIHDRVAAAPADDPAAPAR